MLWMLFTVALVTLLTWFPFNILQIFFNHSDGYVNAGQVYSLFAATTLMYSNTFTSVIIYFIFDKNFRVSMLWQSAEVAEEIVQMTINIDISKSNFLSSTL